MFLIYNTAIMPGPLQEILITIIEQRISNPFPKIYIRSDFNINIKSTNNIQAIIGPRRAGKTFLMYQLIQELIDENVCKKEDILFLNFEHPQLASLNWMDLLKIIPIYQKKFNKTPKYLFFDEIQNIQDWWRSIRYFHDQGYKIVISWSSSKLLLSEVSTELRWRYSHTLVLPFSFKEILSINNVNIDNVIWDISKAKILSLFDEYLKFWWYPTVYLEKNEIIKRQILSEFYNSIFYRDVINRYHLQDFSTMEILMKYCLDMYSSQFSHQKVTSYFQTMWAKVSKPTVLKYLSYLKEAFFIIECKRFWFAPKSSLIAPKKYYIIDPWFTKLSAWFSEDKWKKLENVVAIQLFRNWYDVLYFNENKECDFVIKDKFSWKIVDAIQVTWDLNIENEKREIQWLIQAMKQLNLKEWKIITYNQENKIEKDWYIIHILPIWKRLI